MSTQLALNPFKKGKKTEVEKVKNVEVGLTPDLEELLSTYKSLSKMSLDTYNKKKSQIFSDMKRSIFSPKELTLFFHYAHYTPLETGMFGDFIYCLDRIFTSDLIQKSYDAGHNNFNFLTKGDETTGLFCYLKGKEDNLINVKVFGDSGSYFFQHACYCNVELFGDADEYFANDTKNCIFRVYGNANRYFGMNSRQGDFTLDGDADYYCGFLSNHSKFLIKGDIGGRSFMGAKHTIIQTPNEKTFNSLKYNIEKTNKLQIVDAGGNMLKSYRGKYERN